VANRRGFRGHRTHLVAEVGGRVVGYAGLERRPDDPAGVYRIFLVTDWRDRPDVPTALYERLETELRRREARSAWLREYAADAVIAEFVRARGFEVTERYELGGLEIVTLRRDLSESVPGA
jgi:hypothetical protein